MTSVNPARAGSQGIGGFIRERDDFYPTPAWCTHALLDLVDFPGQTWEPACGDGAICDVFRARGLDITGTDLIDRGCGGGHDFLLLGGPIFPGPVDNIVTNPPFKHALAFADRALNLARRRVAMLVKFNWIAAPGKSDKPVARRALLTDPRCRFVISLGRGRQGAFADDRFLLGGLGAGLRQQWRAATAVRGPGGGDGQAGVGMTFPFLHCAVCPKARSARAPQEARAAVNCPVLAAAGRWGWPCHGTQASQSGLGALAGVLLPRVVPPPSPDLSPRTGERETGREHGEW